MKTTMKKTVLGAIIVLFATANAVAFEDSLKVRDDKSFDLTLTNVKYQTEITLTDKRNQILFNETVKEGGSFSKSFNMELLPTGDYDLLIENQTKLRKMSLQVSEEKAIAGLTATESTVFKPTVFKKGDDVYVTQFSPNQKPLYIAIYNSKNELIHEETLKGQMDLGKKFDFSKSIKGEYHFYLETNGVSFDHLVYVEK